MRGKLPILFIPLLTSCTTLDQSFQLGAATGALTGATTSLIANSGNGKTAEPETVAIGAAVGLGLGLFVSYFIHEQVVRDREDAAPCADIYFGDLPPSPFVIPQQNRKKGSIR